MNIITVLPADAKIHPLAHQYQNKFIVYTSKSTSRNMPLVLSLMQKGLDYAEIDIGNSQFYAAVFDLNSEQITNLYSVIQMASGWKGFNLFINGELVINQYEVADTLNCYMTAIKCRDTKAHCQVVHKIYSYSDNESTSFMASLFSPQKRVASRKWLVPCRKISYYVEREIDVNHPSSPSDQLQALCVQKSCSWCPLLNVSDFRSL